MLTFLVINECHDDPKITRHKQRRPAAGNPIHVILSLFLAASSSGGPRLPRSSMTKLTESERPSPLFSPLPSRRCCCHEGKGNDRWGGKEVGEGTGEYCVKSGCEEGEGRSRGDRRRVAFGGRCLAGGEGRKGARSREDDRPRGG